MTAALEVGSICGVEDDLYSMEDGSMVHRHGVIGSRVRISQYILRRQKKSMQMEAKI